MLSEAHLFGRTARRRDVHGVGVTLDSGHCELEGIYAGCIKKSRRAEQGGLRTTTNSVRAESPGRMQSFHLAFVIRLHLYGLLSFTSLTLIPFLSAIMSLEATMIMSVTLLFFWT